MNSLRQIPLHMLMLAGLVGPLSAQEAEAPPPVPATSAKSAIATAYAGISPAVVTERARLAVTTETVPPGVGVFVAFVDPKGPSMGILEEDDILVRLDDQVLVNPEQFRALIRMHQPGDVVKVVAVREDEVVKVDLKLGSRSAPVPVAPKAKKSMMAKPTTKPSDESAPAEAPKMMMPHKMGLTINGQTFELGQIPGGQIIILDPNQGFPPEIIQQFNEMRMRGMAIPMMPGMMPHMVSPQTAPAAPVAPEKQEAARAPSVQSKSKSFSFTFGAQNGAAVTSSSVASDKDGTVAVDERDGKKHAVIKDVAGKVLFDGDVTTDADREKIPAEIRQRLKLVESGSFTIRGTENVAPSADEQSDEEERPKKKKRDPKEGV